MEVDFSDLKKTLLKLLEDQQNPPWSLTITRTDNGYSLKGSDGTDSVIEDSEKDELLSGESLLWTVMEYFNFSGSKHDPERLRIVRQKRPKDGS